MRRLTLIALLLCAFLLSGGGLVDGIPPGDVLPSPGGDILDPDAGGNLENGDSQEVILYGVQALQTHWKEAVLLAADEELTAARLPETVIYESVDSSGDVSGCVLEMTWAVEDEALSQPGLHYIIGTPVLREGLSLEEGFDGLVAWPVFRMGEGAVLTAVPVAPDVSDSMITEGGDVLSEISMGTTSRRFNIGEDGYLELDEDCLWTWDASSVDSGVLGSHTITGTLTEYPVWIEVPQEEKTVTRDVFVLPTDRIELYAPVRIWIGKWLVFNWLYDCTNVSGAVLERQTADGQWEACEKDQWYTFYVAGGAGELDLNLLNIPTEVTHTLRLRYQDVVNGENMERITESITLTLPANIGELLAQFGEKVPPGITDGDRDGGDSGGTDLPDYEQPAPETPAETQPEDTQPETEPTTVPETQPETQPPAVPETQPATEPPAVPETQPATEPPAVTEALPTTAPPSEPENHPQPTQAPVKEVVTDTYSAISGLRVRRLAALDDTVLFEKQGVSLEIPSEVLEQLNLGDYDLLEVTIKRPQRNGVRIIVEADGKAVTDLGGSMLYLPWDGSDGRLLECRDADGALAGEVFFDETSGIARFAVSTPGTFFLTAAPEPETQPAEVPTTAPAEPTETVEPSPEMPEEKGFNFSVLIWLLPLLLAAAAYEAYVLWRRWRNG